MNYKEIFIRTFEPVYYEKKEYFDYVIQCLKNGGWITKENEAEWKIDDEKMSLFIPHQKYIDFPLNTVRKNSIGKIVLSKDAINDNIEIEEGGLIENGTLFPIENTMGNNVVEENGILWKINNNHADKGIVMMMNCGEVGEKVNKNEPYFYFHVEMESNYDNAIFVYIDPISHWEKEHRLISNYSENQWEPLRDILDELGLDSCISSVFINTKYKTVDELKNALLKYSIFSENKEFSDFVKKNSFYPYDDEHDNEWVREYISDDKKYEKEHQNDKARFYIHVVKDEDMEDGEIVAYIEPISHWEKEHCLADWYTYNQCKKLNLILRELQIYECTESVYENNDKYKTIKSLKNALLKYPIFAENKEFSDFLKENPESG